MIPRLRRGWDPRFAGVGWLHVRVSDWPPEGAESGNALGKTGGFRRLKSGEMRAQALVESAWEKVERRLERGFRARPRMFGSSLVIERRRPFPLGQVINGLLSEEERDEWGDLVAWPGSLSQLLEENGVEERRLLSFHWRRDEAAALRRMVRDGVRVRMRARCSPRRQNNGHTVATPRADPYGGGASWQTGVASGALDCSAQATCDSVRCSYRNLKIAVRTLSIELSLAERVCLAMCLASCLARNTRVFGKRANAQAERRVGVRG